MGLLNRFFRSPESIAKEIVADDATLIKMWQDYVASTKEKGAIITAVTPGNVKQVITRLKDVLLSELVKTTADKKTEQELINDLDALKHDENIKRVKQLENTLCSAQTQYEYVHRLLQELWQILNRQLHVVEKLAAGSTQEAQLLTTLKESWEIEQHILAQINGEFLTTINERTKRTAFHEFFVQLLKGERIIRQLTKMETKFVARAEKETGITNRLLSLWTHEIHGRLRDKIHEELVNYRLDSDQYSHFQFVNSPAFVNFAREVLQSLRQTKPISESTLNAFVHVFREWYNRTAPQ